MLSDARLLTQLSAGDKGSFETLFLRHYPRVCDVLFRLLGNRADAEDLAQQVFMKLYHAPERVKHEAGDVNLIGWLYRVAMNEGYNALRSRKRRTAWQELLGRWQLFGPAAIDPAGQAERQDEQGRVRRVLAELKPREAQLLLLRYAGLSYKELAATLNVAPGSVGSLLTRAERNFARKYRQAFGEKE